MPGEFISSGSHIGSGFRNWDRVKVSVKEDSLLAVLADGVGGHIHGGVAAEMAVETFCELHDKNRVTPAGLYDQFLELTESMRNFNLEMATTIVLVFIRKRKEKLDMHYTWAGDSRLFLLTEKMRRMKRGAFAGKRNHKRLYILTEDDTIPWKYFENGVLTLDQVTFSSGRNRLFFSLPRDGEKMNGRIVSTGLNYGDSLFLCSDGFWERFGSQMDISGWMESDIGSVGTRFNIFMDNEVSGGMKVDNSSFIRIDLNRGLFREG